MINHYQHQSNTMKLVSTWLNTKKNTIKSIITIIQTWSWLSTTINHHYKLDNHYQPSLTTINHHYKLDIIYIYTYIWTTINQPLTLRFTTIYRSSAYLQQPSDPSPCLVPLEILLAIARLVLSPILWHLRGRRRQQISSVIQSQPKKPWKRPRKMFSIRLLLSKSTCWCLSYVIIICYIML